MAEQVYSALFQSPLLKTIMHMLQLSRCTYCNGYTNSGHWSNAKIYSKMYTKIQKVIRSRSHYIINILCYALSLCSLELHQPRNNIIVTRVLTRVLTEYLHEYVSSPFTSRVVTCEFGNFLKFPAENFRKFILIFPEISGNSLITYVNRLFPSPTLQSDVVK